MRKDPHRMLPNATLHPPAFVVACVRLKTFVESAVRCVRTLGSTTERFAPVFAREGGVSSSDALSSRAVMHEQEEVVLLMHDLQQLLLQSASIQ